ncbi:reverse transcriptase domain-containing protein [Alistipes sp.]|uniref:reverse transcriptase domain-containing protein n=1 Tax=Alistipes sp. TaxID=1872444 RepID=UPI003AF00416
MRRDGHIIEEVVATDNMKASFRSVLRGKDRKCSRVGRYLLAHEDEVIAELQRRIADGSYRVSGYREMNIVEAGKLRKIQVIPLKDRIAVNAIMRVVDEHLHRRFIRTSSASIRNRGMHDLMEYIRRDLAQDREGTRYCYTFDIRKFYESVDQQVAVAAVRRVFKDEKLIAMLEGFVHMMPQGLSMGLRSSQGLANLILSIHLDHELKDRLGLKYYYRYCDDGRVLAGTKAELWKVRDAVHRCVEAIGLEVKSNERITPIEEGIDFLGYVIYPDHVRLRKRNKQNFARKMASIQSKRRKRELTASFYGMTKHADCRRLFNQLTGINMKNFKDLGVAYTPADGKKRFKGTVISIRELVNLPVIVHDFETGITTEHGDDRCIVQIEMNGEMRKFFTDSEEMKSILQQIREMPDGFPFETIIKSEQFGKNKTKYIFT